MPRRAADGGPPRALVVASAVCAVAALATLVVAVLVPERWAGALPEPLRALQAGVAGHTRSYVVYDGGDYRGAALERASAEPRAVEPARRLPDGSLEIVQARDGHYHVAGSVNGFPVVFLVDTGATNTGLPASVAANAGIRAGRAVRLNTAAGEAAGAISAGNVVSIGPESAPLRADGVKITIGERLRTPLLGIDVLDRFEVTTRAGRMVLRPLR